MKIILSFLIVACTFPAFAQNTENRGYYDSESPRGGLFIEPIVSFSQVTSEIKTSRLPLLNDDSSGKSEGAGLGLRLGGHVSDMFFLAADARYSKMKFSDSAYGDAEGNSYNYGPSVGLQTPFMGIRVWGTYVMGGQYDPASGTNGMDANFTDARGSRFGAGIRFAALSLNLEYEDLRYDKTEIQSVGGFNFDRSTDLDLESKGYMLSLSFPLSL